MTLGVTAIVCCYNSAARLPTTLAHLAAQRVPEGVGFEVVLVDNASTDDTAAAAVRAWPLDHPYPLRVVTEHQPGLSHARIRGLTEAQYPFVSFIDDDNWVCPEWVAIVCEVLSAHPDVGAVGGEAIASCEHPPPDWFVAHASNYAVGPQAEVIGDVTNACRWLYGAGLSIRLATWEQLHAKGFGFLLTDRTRAGLTGGGDAELCYAIRLAGWKLWYEPRLQLKHYMPNVRLSWNYLQNLVRGNAISLVALQPYMTVTAIRNGVVPNWLAKLKTEWWAILVIELMRLMTSPLAVYYLITNSNEKHHNRIVPALFKLGRIEGARHFRGKLRQMKQQILHAKWVQENTHS